MNPSLSLTLTFVFLVVLTGILLFWLPRLTRPDLYFAVTVPAGFRDSAEGRRILALYRAATAASSVIGFCLALAGGWQVSLALAAAGVLVQDAGSFLAYLSARHRVMPQGANPTAVREAALEPRPARLPGGWLLQAGPFALLAAAALYLNHRWADIPERFPVHWGLDGLPNGWSRHTPAGVYGPLLEGAVVCVMLAGLAWALLRWSRPIHLRDASGSAEDHFRRVVLGMLLAVEYLLALVFAYTVLLPLTRTPPSLTFVLVLPLLFVAVVTAVLAVQGQGGSRRLQALVSAPEGEEPVGDRTPDRYWKVGIFYVNPDDPALFIEKRFGIGYTLNFGRPGAWMVLVLLLFSPLAVALVVALLGR